MSEEYDSERSTLILDALEYAGLGLPVIPLAGKTPFMERWPQRATTDPGQIESWFRKMPDKNLGIATGNGLIAVDVDPRNGGDESFRKLMRGRKLPVTATARTGSGGNHYLFRVDPTLRIKSRELRPGIDIKGEAGQIAVEPSVHPTTGRDYIWERTPRQGIADAPAWLVQMLLERSRVRTASSPAPKPLDLTRHGDAGVLLADAVVRFPVARRGQRNDAMVRLVGSLLGRGYTIDLTLAIVVEWWRHFHRQGVVGTPLSQAPRLVSAAIRSMSSSPSFTKAVGTDHRAAIAGIELTATQISRIDCLVASGTLADAPPTSNRVSDKRKRRVARHEGAFLEALILYFTYKVVHRREDPIQATNDQLRWPLEDRHNLKLSNQQFERLAARYISRPDRPASKFELAVQTSKGCQHMASQYKLTGLKQFLPPIAL